ncbi:MAG: alpha/beta hydrolase [Nocardioides sp.]
MPKPTITRHDVPGDPRALILMLHGGKARSTREVGGRSLSWRRSLVMQRAIAPAAAEAGVAVWLGRYSVVGWNADAPGGPSPIPDARWALDRVRARFGQLPIVLLGHSMGARTAVAVADDPDVLGVVALAPWLPPDEPVAALAGKHLVAAHGHRDRITSYAHTKAFVTRAATVAASATMLEMGDLGHYMLVGSARWTEEAGTQCLGMIEMALSRR